MVSRRNYILSLAATLPLAGCSSNESEGSTASPSRTPPTSTALDTPATTTDTTTTMEESPTDDTPQPTETSTPTPEYVVHGPEGQPLATREPEYRFEGGEGQSAHRIDVEGEDPFVAIHVAREEKGFHEMTILTADDPDGRPASDFQQRSNSNYRGTVGDRLSPGRYFFEIESQCPWSAAIHVIPTSNLSPSTLPLTMTGVGDQVVGPIALSGSVYIAAPNADMVAPGFFYRQPISEGSDENLLGTETSRVDTWDAGEYLFQVSPSGPHDEWEILLESVD